jgi:glycine/D-amino acid oxidase-like deaminating enzyme
VGAGLAGLCTAWWCAVAGASVVVIDAGGMARRTTGHSTAKLTALHGLTYAELTTGKGAETAAAYAEGNVAALNAVLALIRELDIDCGLTDADAYTCAATDEGRSRIEREAAAARAAGLPVELVEDTELGGLVNGAVKLTGQAHFDPYAFCTGLVARLQERGVTIVEHRRVLDVSESSSGCVVTGDGFSIDCDAAVLTTHLPIVDPALIAARVRPERSYVVAGPSAMFSPAGMYLAADAGWSLRPVAKGTR